MKPTFWMAVVSMCLLAACGQETALSTDSGQAVPEATPTPAPSPTPTPVPTPTFDARKFGSAELDITYCDPNRVVAIGASAGGHLVALMGAADETAVWDRSEYGEQSSRVQAVISMSGLSDFTVKLPSGINSSVYYAFGGLAGDGSPEMAAASPVTYISADDPPFLIIHGDNDGVVPVEQSQILHERLTAAGVPATLVIVENGDHSLQGENTTPTQAEINDIISTFLVENLKLE